MTLTLSEARPPVPPGDLILRVAPSFDPEGSEASKQEFDVGAFAHLQRFEQALAGIGRDFRTFDRLLDFGCGCGRFLRHLGSLVPDVELHGVDIDAEMIAWCEANIPYATTITGPHEPPLPYPDAHFDLVINHSVFTHLDERYQDMWLAELRRVTAPGGVLMLTVEGTSSWNRTAVLSLRAGDDVERWRDQLESRGILFLSDDHFVGSTHPDFYHSTVHAPWYVFEHWNSFFEIAAYLPDGSISQDLVVLRRRADDALPPRPITRRLPAAEGAPPPPQASGSGELVKRAAQLVEHWLARRSASSGVASLGGDATALADQQPPLDRERLERELNMLRAGLYEQGNRISVIASELRAEIASLKRES